MNSLTDNLSQGERLALAPLSPIIISPSELGEVEAVTLSTPSGGFRMPSMRDVRMHDARLSFFGGMASMHDSDDDESDQYTYTGAEFSSLLQRATHRLRDNSALWEEQRTINEWLSLVATQAY